MKASELRDLTPGEVEGKIEGMQSDYFNMRFQHKMGQLSNPSRLRQVRREIATAKTVLNQKRRDKKASAKQTTAAKE
jgi:large subunit ribosomal protein L29